MLGDLANWVQDVINQFGYFGVALLVVIENIFPPIPSEIVLPFAGFVAQQGSAGVAQSDTSVIGMMIAATIGSVVGALILYVISSAIGPERLRAFVQRFGRWFGVKQTDLLRAEAWFDRRSFVAVPVGAVVFLTSVAIDKPNNGGSALTFVQSGLYRTIAFVLGCVASGLTGYIGMTLASRTLDRRSRWNQRREKLSR